MKEIDFGWLFSIFCIGFTFFTFLREYIRKKKTKKVMIEKGKNRNESEYLKEQEKRSKQLLKENKRIDEFGTNDNSTIAITKNKKTGLNNEIVEISNIILGEEQQKIYEYMKNTSDNLFITGKAGTGKSVLLQYFVNNTDKQVAVVAPTGVSALNVGGQTIHSFFQLGLELQNASEEKDVQDISQTKKSVLEHLDVLVIDEVSMVSSGIMDMIDAKLKYARNNDLPFGGCQMIFFGDLFQLPPVVTNGQISRYLEHKYGTIYYFGIDSIKNYPFKIIELKHVFRQEDADFINILNKIRVGDYDQEILDELNSNCVVEPKDDDYITLTGDNATASKINTRKLNEIQNKEFIYTATVIGDIKQAAMPTDYELHLKVGAHVMMIRNDYTDNTSTEKKKKARWVNGTLGIINQLSDDEIKVEINGVVHSVNKASWVKNEYYYNSNTKRLEKEAVASFTQYPIRLAYAVTIHKSQGQTYESVKIDLSRGSFATGQTYVALSRCRKMNSLYLENKLKPEDILVSQEVLNYMKNNNIDINESREGKEDYLSINKEEENNINDYRIYDVEQGSIEWLKLRENKVTASNAYLLNKHDVEYVIEKNKYNVNNYENEAMMRGHELESEGILKFAKLMNMNISTVGFIESMKYSCVGCSPDGVIFEGDNIKTIIEHKAFKAKHHYECHENIDDCILFQIQFEMFITGAKDAYLILYNPDIINQPDDQLFYHHITKDEKIQSIFIKKLEKYKL